MNSPPIVILNDKSFTPTPTAVRTFAAKEIKQNLEMFKTREEKKRSIIGAKQRKTIQKDSQGVVGVILPPYCNLIFKS